MISTSPKKTEQAGKSLAAQLRPGDVLLLRGELGAGKSVFARGIARGLGIEGAVASPTFTLLNCYEGGRLPFFHMDLYRLDDEDAFYEAGLSDVIGGSGVALIEWPERAMGALPECHLDIEIQYGNEVDIRTIAIVPSGGFREVTL